MLFRFISDPGHGWLETDRAMIKRVGIENKISSYSYQKGFAVYLEEDCDAPLFIEALKTIGIYNIELKRVYQENTFVRRCQSYQK